MEESNLSLFYNRLKKVRLHSKNYKSYAMYLLLLSIFYFSILFIRSDYGMSILTNNTDLVAVKGVIAILAVITFSLLMINVLVNVITYAWKKYKSLPLLDENFFNKNLWFYDSIWIFVLVIIPIIERLIKK